MELFHKENCQQCMNPHLTFIAFYNYARSKTKCRTGISDLVMTNGTMTVNDTEKADTVNDFFSSVFTPVEDTGTIPTLQDRPYIWNHLPPN